MGKKEIVLKIFGWTALYVILFLLLINNYVLRMTGIHPVYMILGYTAFCILSLFYFSVINLIKKKFTKSGLQFLLLIIIGIMSYYFYLFSLAIGKVFEGMVG